MDSAKQTQSVKATKDMHLPLWLAYYDEHKETIDAELSSKHPEYNSSWVHAEYYLDEYFANHPLFKSGKKVVVVNDYPWYAYYIAHQKEIDDEINTKHPDCLTDTSGLLGDYYLEEYFENHPLFSGNKINTNYLQKLTGGDKINTNELPNYPK